MRLSVPALVLVVLCVFALLLTGCPKPQQPPTAPPMPTTGAGAPPGPGPAAGEPLVIGCIFSVTGQAGAPLGEPEKATVEMIATQINGTGGVNGRPLKLVIEDDGSEESKAVLAAKKLIEQDKVLAIVGPTLSGPSMAIIKPCTDAGVPLFSCAASAKITSPIAERKWVFSSAQTDALAVERLVDHLKAQQIKTVGIICDSNKFGQSGAEQLKAQLPKAGVQIVDEEKFASKDTSMVAQLTKIKAKNPDGIVCWGTNPGPAVVAKNAASLGLKSKLFMSHGIANMKFIELAGAAAEGVIFPAGYLTVAGELPDGNPQKAVLTKYAADFQTATGKPANTFGGHAFDALQMVLAAIRAGATDRVSIRNGLEKISNHAGIGGTFNLSATDHNGLTKDAFALVTIQGGKWTLVK
ncbi:ABC transporter substrate-binding protein [bacterium]|nr:ABC transporter substrate-binding protein [bacterium]